MQRVRSRYIDLKVAAGFAADAGTYGFQIGSLFIGATCVGRLCFTYWGPDATFDPHHLRIMAQVENVSEIFRILTRFVSAHAKRPPQADSGFLQVVVIENASAISFCSYPVDLCAESFPMNANDLSPADPTQRVRNFPDRDFWPNEPRFKAERVIHPQNRHESGVR